MTFANGDTVNGSAETPSKPNGWVHFVHGAANVVRAIFRFSLQCHKKCPRLTGVTISIALIVLAAALIGTRWTLAVIAVCVLTYTGISLRHRLSTIRTVTIAVAAALLLLVALLPIWPANGSGLVASSNLNGKTAAIYLNANEDASNEKTPQNDASNANSLADQIIGGVLAPQSEDSLDPVLNVYRLGMSEKEAPAAEMVDGRMTYLGFDDGWLVRISRVYTVSARPLLEEVLKTYGKASEDNLDMDGGSDNQSVYFYKSFPKFVLFVEFITEAVDQYSTNETLGIAMVDRDYLMGQMRRDINQKLKILSYMKELAVFFDGDRKSVPPEVDVRAMPSYPGLQNPSKLDSDSSVRTSPRSFPAAVEIQRTTKLPNGFVRRPETSIVTSFVGFPEYQDADLFFGYASFGLEGRLNCHLAQLMFPPVGSTITVDKTVDYNGRGYSWQTKDGLKVEVGRDYLKIIIPIEGSRL